LFFFTEVELAKVAAGAGRALVWIGVGTILGSASGEILARLLPPSGLTRFLTASVPLGTSHPLTLDVRVVELTFGALFRLNLLGLVGGIGVLVALFRKS
jgi:hypothetical protein